MVVTTQEDGMAYVIATATGRFNLHTPGELLSLSFANGHVLQSSIYIKRRRGDPGATQVSVVVVALELIEEGRAG